MRFADKPGRNGFESAHFEIMLHLFDEILLVFFSNIDVHVSGDGSMAWATFNEATEYKFDGNPVKQSAVFTAVFEKADGAWMMKILHRSVAPPPADN